MTKALKHILTAATFLVTLAILFSVWLLIIESKSVEDSTYDLNRLAAWGDTIGGALSPLLSFLALIGLLYTISHQIHELELSRQEVELTREELKGSKEATERLVSATERQNVENSFFQILALMQNNLQEIDVEGNYNGTDAFKIMHKEFLLIYTSKTAANEKGSLTIDEKNEFAKDSYQKIYKEHDSDLGRYFRIFHNLAIFIIEKKSQITIDMYETYCNLVRATLSDYELTLILLDSRLIERTKPLEFLEELKIFKNLNTSLLKGIVETPMGTMREYDLTHLAKR